RDLLQVIAFALQQPALSGPINAVAPAPVRHREFMQTLATTLQRRILLCIPRKLVRRMLGELSDLFLTRQRLTPERVIAAGFQFQYADVPAAFEDIFGAAPQPATPLAVYSNDNCSVCRGEMAQYRAANARAGHPIE